MCKVAGGYNVMDSGCTAKRLPPLHGRTTVLVRQLLALAAFKEAATMQRPSIERVYLSPAQLITNKALKDLIDEVDAMMFL